MTAEREWSFPFDAKVDVVFSDGSHRYYSTHCRHARSMKGRGHKKCSATRLALFVPRKPAQCKTCGSPCICECHRARS